MTSLNFTKDSNGKYVASFTSTGDTVAVQVHRNVSGALGFLGNIGSMSPVEIEGVGSFFAPADILVSVCMPKDVIVTIVSDTEVIEGGYV